MSSSDRKAVIMLSVLRSMAGVTIDNEDAIFSLIDTGIKLFNNKLSIRELKKIESFIEVLFRRIVFYQYQITPAFFISFLNYITNDFLIYLKDHSKVKVWKDMNEYSIKAKEILNVDYEKEINDNNGLFNLIINEAKQIK